MGINFEPRQAFNSSVAEAYGASLARQQTAELNQRAEAVRAQASMQQAALDQANAHFYDQQFHQSDLQQQHISAQFGLQNQHADIQAQLNQTQLNQAEQMRLQRLDRQVEYVTANMGDGKLYTPEDGQAMISQLRTGLDPLKQRAERAQLLQTQAATEHIQNQNAMQATMLNRDGAFHAKTLRDRTSVLLDPGIEADVRRQYDPDGMVHPDDEAFQSFLEQEVGRRGGATRVFESSPGHYTPLPTPVAPGTSGAANANGVGGIPDALHNTIIHDIETHLDKEEREARTADIPAPAWAETPETKQAEFERRYNSRMDRLNANKPPSPASAQTLNDLNNSVGQAIQRLRSQNQPAATASLTPGQLEDPNRVTRENGIRQLGQIRDELSTIISRYPSIDRAPESQRRRAAELYARLQQFVAPTPAPAANSFAGAVNRMVGSAPRPAGVPNPVTGGLAMRPHWLLGE